MQACLKSSVLSISFLLKSTSLWGILHLWTNPNYCSSSFLTSICTYLAHELEKLLGASAWVVYWHNWMAQGNAMTTWWENGKTMEKCQPSCWYIEDQATITNPPISNIVRSPSPRHIKLAQVSKGCTRTGYRLSKVRPFPSWPNSPQPQQRTVPEACQPGDCWLKLKTTN